MSMYGYDSSVYDYGFSDPSIANSFYTNPILAGIDYEDDLYARRRPPTRHTAPITNPTSPPKHCHDGTSPLPLGMDWSLPPRVSITDIAPGVFVSAYVTDLLAYVIFDKLEGRNSVWPHDSQKKWSYCVTVPSWIITPSASGSDTVFFRVQVGIQSPEGFTSTRDVLRRFNEFVKLYNEIRKEFPKKDLPPVPPKRLMKMRSKTLLEERRCALEGWTEKLLSDIDVSRTLLVAIFLELEAAARQACSELTQNDTAANTVPSDQFPSNSETFTLGSSSSISSDIENPVESMKATTIDQNEMLLKELDDAKRQIEILKKQQDEVVLKSKSDVKHLVKEVKSLRTSNSELKQELDKCFEEKLELEKEKQKWEAGNATKVALLHECELLRNRLRDCSVNFILDEEDKLMVDTSLSDAIDLLETSDSQIGLLLAEVQLLANKVDNSSDIPINKEDKLRLLLGDISTDNAKLRKQVNSVIRQVLSKPDNSVNDDTEDDELMLQ